MYKRQEITRRAFPAEFSNEPKVDTEPLLWAEKSIEIIQSSVGSSTSAPQSFFLSLLLLSAATRQRWMQIRACFVTCAMSPACSAGRLLCRAIPRAEIFILGFIIYFVSDQKDCTEHELRRADTTHIHVSTNTAASTAAVAKGSYNPRTRLCTNRPCCSSRRGRQSSQAGHQTCRYAE